MSIDSAAKCEIRADLQRVFETLYGQEGDDFLKCIVTGDETWVHYYTPETKK